MSIEDALQQHKTELEDEAGLGVKESARLENIANRLGASPEAPRLLKIAKRLKTQSTRLQNTAQKLGDYDLSIGCLSEPEIDCPIEVVNFAFNSATGKVTWSTQDEDGDPLPTTGELKYGATPALGQTSGASNSFYVDHTKTDGGNISLQPGTEYCGVVCSEDENGNICDSEIFKFTTTGQQLQHVDGWTSDFVCPDLPGNWTLIDARDEGYAQNTDRITTGETHLGCPAYKHNVQIGDQVETISQESPCFQVDFSQIDKVRLRFHMCKTAYSGDPGKHLALMAGYGYGSDNFPNTPKTSAQAHGSTEGAVINAMHPRASGSTSVNDFRAYASCSNLIPNPNTGGYYGTAFGQVPCPLGAWIAIDMVMTRTSYELYTNCQLAGELDCPPFKNWNNQKALWYRHRHMHGGNPEKLIARFNYCEFFGGFSLYTG